MTRTDELHTLKTLDPAAADIDPNGPRARLDLERILATDPAYGLEPQRNRKVARRVALGAGLVAATTTAAVVLPSAIGGDEAFATWTAAPSGMSAKDGAGASASCRDQQKVHKEYRKDLSTASTAISERRGEWTLVILAARDGFSALCITDASTPLFRDFFGSIGRTAPADLPGPRELTPTGLGTGSASGNELSVATGHAGADVTAVSYTSVKQGTVEATVSGGHFALWLPGGELESANRAGVPVQVTYRDGTTATITLKL